MSALVTAFMNNYTLRVVSLGAVFLGALGGIMGCFATLRRQSLLGDALSHAALPGIALAFIVTGTRSLPALLVGATLAGLLGALSVTRIARYTKLKNDAALAIVLSTFFGLGLMLLSYAQKLPNAAQAGLEAFLFGQAAAMSNVDAAVIGAILLVVIGVTILFWKEMKAASFDTAFAATSGIPVTFIETLIAVMLVIAIVCGLQVVGVILMSAMLVAPAIAARQWARSLRAMVCISAFFGALSGFFGAYISSVVPRLPTGPTIVVFLSAVALLSLFFAPERGIVSRKLRELARDRRLHVEGVLEDFYILATTHGEERRRGHKISVLIAMSGGHGGVKRSVKTLREMGFVEKNEFGLLTITENGYRYVEMRRKERQT